ncbi:MAG: phage holin family protein [Candidatus Portnoybacteria bacterium]|nr:phage holin family protein [Candidatus Portnoybacteria bacterium]
MRFIIRVLANSLTIYLAAYLIPGVTFRGDWKTLLLAGLILALINIFVKPVLKFISWPFIVLTLGLFSFIINIFLVWTLTKFIPDLTIMGLWAYIGVAIIISAANIIINWLTKKRPIEPQN